jgi:hypothetical protein
VIRINLLCSAGCIRRPHVNIPHIFSPSYASSAHLVMRNRGKDEEVADDFYDERRRLQVTFSVCLVDRIDCVKACLS